MYNFMYLVMAVFVALLIWKHFKGYLEDRKIKKPIKEKRNRNH